MICPIVTAALHARGQHTFLTEYDEAMEPGECYDKECAWWDDQQECCVTMTVAATLIHIAASLKGVIRVRGPQ